MGTKERMAEDFRRITNIDDDRVLAIRVLYYHFIQETTNLETGSPNELFFEHHMSTVKAKRPDMEKLIQESIVPYDALIFFFDVETLLTAYEPTVRDYIIYNSERYDVKGIILNNDDNVYEILTQRIRK